MKIWESRLDDKYDVYVVEDEGGATVCLELEGVILAEEPTTLSYGAIFGPDVSDVQGWQNWAVDVVDNQLQK